MRCPYCDSINTDSSKFCKNCGNSLNPVSTMKKDYLESHKTNNYKNQEYNSNYSIFGNTKNLIIICLTILVSIGLIMGTVFYIASNNYKYTLNNNLNNYSVNNNSINQSNDDVNEDINDISTENETNYISNNDIKIISGNFYTGNHLPDKTYCTIYVGSQHSNEKIKISVLYSSDGNILNSDDIVQKRIDDNGYVTVESEKFKHYPDYATITLYDFEENILDTTEVTMSATSGNQTFS